MSSSKSQNESQEESSHAREALRQQHGITDESKLNRYFVTFGLGSILGKSYLVAYAPDETTLRVALNAAKLPWCGCYGVDQFTDAIAKYGLVRLPRDFEATEFNAGPVARALFTALKLARPYVQDTLDQLDDDDAEAIEGTRADLAFIDAAIARATGGAQ